MNMSRRIGALVVVVMMAAALVACNEPEAMYEMAAFDRAYIPALMMTAGPDSSGKSVMAVKELKLEFMVFKSRNADSVGWDDSLGQVEDMIMKADLNINAGDYKASHAALKGISHVMYELRKDVKINDYILDRMAEFQDVMEQIHETADGKAPEALTRADISRISRLLPKAKERWEAVAASPFSPGVFQFTSGKADKLTAQFEKERAALLSLNGAVVRHDKEKILEAVTEMKAEYETALKLFGNFGAVSLGPA